MLWNFTRQTKNFGKMLYSMRPRAGAKIKGSEAYPELRGSLWLYPLRGGTLVAAEVYGLPAGEGGCGVFGFHIHEGGSCTGTPEDSFADAGGHLNPENLPHPCHMGDMPPLFSNSGFAWMAYCTERFTWQQVVGHNVIIHSMPDDFKTQPSGDSGDKIACGVIEPV